MFLISRDHHSGCVVAVPLYVSTNSAQGLRIHILTNTLATDVKSRLIRKDPDARRGRRQEEKGTPEEMAGWHHRLNGHESEQVPEMVKDREAWYKHLNAESREEQGERRKPSSVISAKK